MKRLPAERFDSATDLKPLSRSEALRRVASKLKRNPGGNDMSFKEAGVEPPRLPRKGKAAA